MGISVKVTVDNTLKVMKDIKNLSNIDVLVGVPESTTKRETGEVTNAELVLTHTKGVPKKAMMSEIEETMSKKGVTYNDAHALYIQSHGSPLWKIPPRPIIEPAIEADGNKERIAEDLRIAGELLLSGKKGEAIEQLNVAGMDGVNIIRAWFEDPRNNWPPNSPLTIRSKRKKGKKGTFEPQVLIDTGQMRDSMTYIVKDNTGE